MLLAVIVLVVLARSPVADAAVPNIHAHRGGTVENGKARFAEESNCEYFFRAGRKPAGLASVRTTVRFDGNARVLPALEGPERVLPRTPDFSP